MESVLTLEAEVPFSSTGVVTIFFNNFCSNHKKIMMDHHTKKCKGFFFMIPTGIFTKIVVSIKIYRSTTIWGERRVSIFLFNIQ